MSNDTSVDKNTSVDNTTTRAITSRQNPGVASQHKLDGKVEYKHRRLPAVHDRSRIIVGPSRAHAPAGVRPWLCAGRGDDRPAHAASGRMA